MANNDIHYIRKELDNLQTRMRTMDIRTEYAISNSDTVPPTTGWSTVRPVAEEGEFIWARNIINMGYGDITTEPYLVGDGTEHILSLDVEYISWGDAFSPPPQDSPYWQTTAPAIDDSHYIWSRDVIVTNNGTKYTSPVRITGTKGAKGDKGDAGQSIKGEDGKGFDFIYYTTDDANFGIERNRPADDVVRTQNQYDRWCDSPTPVNSSHPYIYMSLRTTLPNTDPVQWGHWSIPVLNSSLGEKGEDGEGFEIVFMQTTTETTTPNFLNANNQNTGVASYTGADSTGKHYQDADYLPAYGTSWWTDNQQGVTSTYRYEWASYRFKRVGNDGNATWDNFNPPKIWARYSEDGESNYIHIRYSTVNNPSSSNQISRLPNANYPYIGTLVDHTDETDSSTMADYDDPTHHAYSWSLFKPRKGIEYDGRFLHIKYANWVIFDDEGFVDDYEFTDNDGEDAGAWIGTLFDYTEDDSDDGTAYTWKKIEGRGILTVVEEYGVSNSSATPPVTWYTDVSSILVNNKFQKGKWYWTRSHIYYTDVDDEGNDDEVVGTRIINMVDSDTEHYIFFRTATNTVPTTPTSSTPIIDNKNQEGKDIALNSWFEEVISPTAELPYLWCSMQEYNGLSKGWGAYCTPYLVDTYSFDGTVGEQGDTGGRGSDGTQLTGEDIEDKTTDITSKTMANCVPSDFVPSKCYSWSTETGGHTTYVNRQGNIIIINFRAIFTSTGSEDLNQYVTLFELPSWAMPLEPTFFDDVLHPFTFRVIMENDSPVIQYYNTNPSDVWHGTSTVVYFAGDSVRTEPLISLLNANTNIKLGNSIRVEFKDIYGAKLSNTVVYFKVKEDGVIYKEITDNDGIAELNINTPLNGDVVAVWYDGYDYVDSEITTPSEKYRAVQKTFNITTNPVSVTHINWDSDDKGYYFEVITGTGKPLRYAEVDINIMSEGFWTAYTDGYGKVHFDLMGYDAHNGVEVFIRLNESDKVFSTVYDAHVFKLSSADQTVSRFPMGVAGVNWEGLDKCNLASPRDDKFVKSTVVAYNSYCPVLRVDFNDLKIPHNATVTNLKVSGVFASLEGTTQISRPKLGTPVIIGGNKTSLDNTYTFTNQNNVSWDYTNCGKWQSVNYTCAISSSDTNNWEDFSLYIGGGLNGGDTTRKDDGRFAVDYIKLEVDYTVDNSKSLLPPSAMLDIQVGNLEKYYGGVERFEVTVLANGSPAQGKTVNITFNDNTYSRTTDANGKAGTGINLVSGKYPVSVEVDDYQANAWVIIKPTIWFDEIDNYILENSSNNKIKVNCRLSNGDNYNGEIMTNIQGVDGTATVENGVAEVPLNMSEGDYILTVGNNNTGERTACNVHVTPRIRAESFSKYYRCDKQLEAYILESDGTIAVGKSVEFNINGVKYTRQTDNNGKVKLNINLQPSTYPVTISCDGVSKTINITVLPRLTAHDLVKTYGTSDPFEATLVGCDGRPVEGANIEFNINGVFYERLTDSSGVARLNINLMPSKYIITTSYNGESIANTVTVRT